MTDATITKTAPATAKKPRVAATAQAAAKVVKAPAKPAPKVAAKPVTAKAAVAPLAKTPSASVPKVEPVALQIVAPVPAAAKAAQLKMKDLIERVVKASGAKKKGVKEIVEATLATLGDALAKGEAINLPGFGRAKVAHAEDKAAGKPMTIKMKSQSAADPKKPGKLPLAVPQD